MTQNRKLKLNWKRWKSEIAHYEWILSSSQPHVKLAISPYLATLFSAIPGVLGSSYSYGLLIKRGWLEHIPSLRSHFWGGASLDSCLFRTFSPHCECVMAIGAIPHRMYLRLYLMWDIESISIGVDLKNRLWYWIPIIWYTFCMY